MAEQFGTDITRVAIAVTLTLAMRPVGALIFGYIADTFGWRITLMPTFWLIPSLNLRPVSRRRSSGSSYLRALYGMIAWAASGASGLRSTDASRSFRTERR